MDPQQPPRNPVETNIESEHHGSSIGSGDQGVHMSQGVQGAPQPSLPDEMARSPSQGALVESPRGLPAAMPPARPIADLPHAYYDKSGYEGIPSGGRYWEGPYDARGGRYPTSRAPGRVRTAESMRRQMPAYGDYQVQSEQRVNSPPPRSTVQKRLKPLLEQARERRNKLQFWANSMKWSLSLVSFIQIFLGAMTTGVSALRLDGQKLGVATTILGILTTLSGAIVAKVRADGEPEQSLLLAHDLDLFIRKCEDFDTDCGHEDGNKFDDKIHELRNEFDQIMRKNRNASSTSSSSGKKDKDKEKDKEKSDAQDDAGRKV